MQQCRITTRVVPRATRAPNPARTMFTSPFFPHAEGGLFRAFDSAVADLVPMTPRQSFRRTFTPKFDVREISGIYELQGELPGMDQKDLDIEFLDAHTLLIRGKSIRESMSANVDTDNAAKKPVVKKDIGDDTSERSPEKSANYQKVTVEDEYVDAAAEANEESRTPNFDDAGSVKSFETKSAKVEPSFKYWVSERSVGEFERRFSFPGRVDQDAVKASLKDGILSIVVPKLAEKQARRIEIS